MPLEFRPANTDQTVQLDFGTSPPVAMITSTRYAILRVRMIATDNTQIDSIQPDDQRMHETLARALSSTAASVVMTNNVLCFNFDTSDPPCLFGHADIKWLMLCHSLFALGEEGVVPITVEFTERANTESCCSICIDTDSGPWSVTRCNHLFHPRCIQGWLRRGGATCPLCRSRF